jgi:predicted nuclease with TOPRIM domain
MSGTVNLLTLNNNDNIRDDIQPIHKEPVTYVLKCNVEVEGNFVVKGTSSISEIAEIDTTKKQLLEENLRLKKRFDELEKKIDMIWYAPGMPGYEETKGHYDTISDE